MTRPMDKAVEERLTEVFGPVICKGAMKFGANGTNVIRHRDLSISISVDWTGLAPLDVDYEVRRAEHD